VCTKLQIVGSQYRDLELWGEGGGVRGKEVDGRGKVRGEGGGEGETRKGRGGVRGRGDWGSESVLLIHGCLLSVQSQITSLYDSSSM